MRRKLAFLAITGLILGLVGSWLVGSLLSRSTNSVVAAAVAPALDVRFAARDGVAIAGTYWPGPNLRSPAILLLHGNGASRAAMAKTAEWLSRRGYAALAIDFRGHGESTPAEHSFGYFEARDASAALVWLKHRQEGAKVGIVGSSLGGAASLIGEDGPLAADAMVLQAVYPDIRNAIRNRIGSRLGSLTGRMIEPFLSYQSRFRLGVWPERLSPLLAIGHVRCPILVIGGGEDRSTPPNETQSLFNAGHSTKEIWIVPGLGHEAMTGPNSDAYLTKIQAFLDLHLHN